MKLNVVKVLIVLCAFTCAGSGQIWDLLLFPEDEIEDESFFDEDYDENSTSVLKLVHYSTSEIQNEKEMLDESSDIIIDEINSMIDIDFVEEPNDLLNEIISEHTLQLYNVISLIKSADDETSHEKKFSFNDIFIWSNESDDKIKDILEDYYRDG